MLAVSNLVIPEGELNEQFVRASGPGGQNVNKVATAVQLRFDVRRSPSLPDAVRERLLRLATARISQEGVLLIEARRFRTQEQNRLDARQRLAGLIQQALTEPKPRRPTKPTRASKERRLEAKRRAARRKQLRRTAPDRDE
jgi:ribosome-associated protein